MTEVFVGKSFLLDQKVCTHTCDGEKCGESVRIGSWKPIALAYSWIEISWTLWTWKCNKNVIEKTDFNLEAFCLKICSTCFGYKMSSLKQKLFKLQSRFFYLPRFDIRPLKTIWLNEVFNANIMYWKENGLLIHKCGIQ